MHSRGRLCSRTSWQLTVGPLFPCLFKATTALREASRARHQVLWRVKRPALRVCDLILPARKRFREQCHEMQREVHEEDRGDRLPLRRAEAWNRNVHRPLR